MPAFFSAWQKTIASTLKACTHASKSHFTAVPTSKQSISSIAYINHSRIFAHWLPPSPHLKTCNIISACWKTCALIKLLSGTQTSCHAGCNHTQHAQKHSITLSYAWISSSDHHSCDCYALMLQVLNRVTFKHISRWDYRFDFSPVPRVKRAKKCRYSSSGSPMSHSRCLRECLVFLQHKRRRNAVSARRHFFTFSREAFCLCN